MPEVHKIRICWYPNQLKEEAKLTLVFEEPSGTLADSRPRLKISKNQAYVIWKTITISPGEKEWEQCEFSFINELGFSYDAPAENGTYRSEAFIGCKKGQLVTLQDSRHEPWTSVEPADNHMWRALNNTQYRRWISFGTMKPTYKPIFMYRVNPKNFAEAEFHPVLKAYLNIGPYEETSLITDASFFTKKHPEPLFTWKFSHESSSTTWDFEEDAKGKYIIEEASSSSTSARVVKPKAKQSGPEPPAYKPIPGSSEQPAIPAPPAVPVFPVPSTVSISLNWPWTLDTEIVHRMFKSIEEECSKRGIGYHEVKHDKEGYRTITASKMDPSPKELAETLSTIINAAVEEYVTPKAAPHIPDIERIMTIGEDGKIKIGGPSQKPESVNDKATDLVGAITSVIKAALLAASPAGAAGGLLAGVAGDAVKGGLGSVAEVAKGKGNVGGSSDGKEGGGVSGGTGGTGGGEKERVKVDEAPGGVGVKDEGKGKGKEVAEGEKPGLSSQGDEKKPNPAEDAPKPGEDTNKEKEKDKKDEVSSDAAATTTTATSDTATELNASKAGAPGSAAGLVTAPVVSVEAASPAQVGALSAPVVTGGAASPGQATFSAPIVPAGASPPPSNLTASPQTISSAALPQEGSPSSQVSTAAAGPTKADASLSSSTASNKVESSNDKENVKRDAKLSVETAKVDPGPKAGSQRKSSSPTTGVKPTYPPSIVSPISLAGSRRSSLIRKVTLSSK